MPQKSVLITRTKVEPIPSSDEAWLTIVFGDGFDAVARIGHAAAVQLMEQLHAFTAGKV